MAWGGIVTKTHKYYLKELGVGNKIKTYMQSLTIAKTLESISLEYRLGGKITTEKNEETKTNKDVSPNELEK